MTALHWRLGRAARLAGASVAALWLAGAAAAELVAERIDEANVSRRQIGGPDAIGGIGDWYLANDLVELVVDDPSRRHAKLDHGGTIVDVGLRDREGEDQFARLLPLVNMSQRVIVGYDAIRAEVDADAGAARLVVTSPGLSSIPRGSALGRRLDPLVPVPEALAAVRVETCYEVRRGERFVRITTELHNTGTERAPVFAWGDLWMRGGRSMRSFVGNLLDPQESRGFHHRSFSRTNLLASTDALVPFTHVAMAGLPAWPPIAYALVSPERIRRELPFFGVTGEHVTFALAFVGDPAWRRLSLWRIASALRGGLAPGERWTHERRLLVSGRADVASTGDALHALLGRTGPAIEGRIEPADLRCAVHVATPDGAPVTQIAAQGGVYRAVVPPGRYRLTLRAPQRAPRRLEVSVVEGGVARPPLQVFEEPGWLVFGPGFADGGPGRVVVQGMGGSDDPVFAPELLDFRIDGELAPSGSETASLWFVGGAGDPGAVAVPPGRYRLTATRGLEWDAARLEVEVPGPGARVEVPPFALARVAELEGWVSADLHVHAQASDDSGTPNEARLRQFAAEGIDVLVATDHDHLPDYAPALARFDAPPGLHVIGGVEVTSSTPSRRAPYTIGHHNAWPLMRQPHEHRGGAPPSQERSVAELYASLRRDHGARVVQLNHARGRDPGLHEGAYFTHLATEGHGLDPRRPLSDATNRALLAEAPDGTRAIDFDAMEVMNGDKRGQHLRLREDWYALQRQGYARTATANSDTHGPDEIAAYPHNYVWLGADAGEFDVRRFDAALQQGRAFGTTGPLVAHFSVNDALMGDLVPAPDGRIFVEYDVEAAPWVPVDEVRLVVDGEVVRATADLAGTLALTLRRDAFVTLEAGAPLGADPATWIAEHPGPYTESIAPDFLPAAFTNPVYVDVDGNGRFDPPGLAPEPSRVWQGARRAAPPLALLLAGGWWWGRRRRADRFGEP